MPGNDVEIEKQRREDQLKLKEQMKQQREEAIKAIRAENDSQAHLIDVAKQKAAKLIAEADKLDAKAEEKLKELKAGRLTSYELLEGALLDCVGHLEIWNEANNKRYIASWYNDPKWGPRLIKAGDFVDKYLDPKNIPHAIQAAGEKLAEKTGLPKKYYDSKYGVKDKQTPQQLQFDYQYDEGKFNVSFSDPFKLTSEEGGELRKFQQLEIQKNFINIMDSALNLKGFKQNPDDQKYYKVDDEGNLTEEVITEKQFKDVRDMLINREFPKDNQAIKQFEDDTDLSFSPIRSRL